MSISKSDREQQVREAEELLFSGPQRVGFAKGLFYGKFAADWITPYPGIDPSQADQTRALIERVRRCTAEHIDARVIDEQANIPESAIQALSETGIFRTTADVKYGGLGLSQVAYCDVLQEIGKVCASTSIFVNVQHSIGLRALLMFGTESQKQEWLTPLLTAEKIAAFALTESEAGSDAANVQTTATPSADGSHYIINGQKRYITNGASAHVLTLMARTPDPRKPEGVVTAFLVTPDMPGFQIVHPNVPKLGIRGTAQAKLAFKDMKVPATNILGKPGQGLKIALSVLNFGRVTFGACCTGAAKTSLDLACRYANQRRQFKQTLGEFELIQKKIAEIAEWTYAMEAMTRVTAGLIDRGMDDYMLETAMLKVYTTEALWTIVNHAFQVYGGAAYFNDEPLERMLRDHRINQIGEGANEVLLSFIALVGLRGPGESLKALGDKFKSNPLGAVPTAARLGLRRIAARLRLPRVPVRHLALEPYAIQLARLIRRFESRCFRAMVTHRESLMEMQLIHERIAWVAMEAFACACVISRLDSELSHDSANDPKQTAKRLAADSFLRHAFKRAHLQLDSMFDNDDETRLKAAKQTLNTYKV